MRRSWATLVAFLSEPVTIDQGGGCSAEGKSYLEDLGNLKRVVVTVPTMWVKVEFHSGMAQTQV
jgi:hypothetical protein